MAVGSLQLQVSIYYRSLFYIDLTTLVINPTNVKLGYAQLCSQFNINTRIKKTWPDWLFDRRLTFWLVKKFCMWTKKVVEILKMPLKSASGFRLEQYLSRLKAATVFYKISCTVIDFWVHNHSLFAKILHSDPSLHVQSHLWLKWPAEG